jgi:hypothetical protein
MIHSGCAAFVTGQRSLSSTSHDTILSVKLERPHGSIERARKHSDDNGSGGGCGVSSQSLSLSFYLLLAEADGKGEREEGREQRCSRKGNPPGTKEGKRSDLRPQPPALIMVIGMSYHDPEYFGNRAYVSCKTALPPRTIRLIYCACCYPTTVQGSGAFLLHEPIIGLSR